MVCLGFEPVAAEWQAHMKPRSYGGLPNEEQARTLQSQYILQQQQIASIFTQSTDSRMHGQDVYTLGVIVVKMYLYPNWHLQGKLSIHSPGTVFTNHSEQFCKYKSQIENQ